MAYYLYYEHQGRQEQYGSGEMLQISKTVFFKSVVVIHYENDQSAGNRHVEIPGGREESWNNAEKISKQNKEKRRAQ